MYTLCDVRGLDRAKILAALFNASRQQGMGVLNPSGVSAMTVEEAQREIHDARRDGRISFDYLRGRVMKVDLTSDDFIDPRGYDRDNGEYAVDAVIDRVREEHNAAREYAWAKKVGLGT